MNSYRSFLLASTMLYSVAALANEKVPSFSYSYQEDNNCYSLTENLHVKPSEPTEDPHAISYFHNHHAHPLSFVGNGFSLTLEQIVSPVSGVCVSSSEDIHFKNFSSLNLIQCTSLSKYNDQTAHSGMIFSGKNISFEQNNVTTFKNNKTAGSGGVLHAHQVAFSNIPSTIFSENSSEMHGGAIHANGLTLSKHHQCIFNENTAGQSGGAIFLDHVEEGKCTLDHIYEAQFTKNQALDGNGGALFSLVDTQLQGSFQLRMQNNQATGSQDHLGCGGAIYCAIPHHPQGITTFDLRKDTPLSPTLHIRNNYLAVFSDNTASQSGGALYCDHLSLEKNTGVYFLRNHAKQGGAIAISDSGSLALHAGSGLIMFQDNYGTSHEDLFVRNAIHLAPRAHFSEISTLGGGSVIFYDPITQGALPADLSPRTLIINPRSDSATSGKVIFSGKHVEEKERAFSENLTSIIHHHVLVASGQLSLEDGARLHVHSFKQANDATLHLQPNTELSTQGDLHVTDIAMSLNHVDSETLLNPEKPSRFICHGNVTMNGRLILTDSDQSFYENHALLNNDEVVLPLIVVSTQNNAPSLETIILSGDLESPYGYQGSWDLAWLHGNQPHTKKLCALWSKSDYVPHPERLTRIVSNSLWNTHADMFTINEILETKMAGEPYSLGVWGSAVSTFFHKPQDVNLPEEISSWHHRSCGYLIGANTHSQSGHVLGIAAGKLYGRSSDISSEQRHSHIVSAFSKLSTPILSLSANASYNKTFHTLTTPYRAYRGEGVGTWESECVSGTLCSELSFTLSENSKLFHSISLFAKAQAFDGKQPMFEEEAFETRQFSESFLRMLSVPVGIGFEGRSKKHVMFYNLSFAYAQDIYKECSKNSTTLKANQFSWPTDMASFDKHAFIFKLAHQRSLNHVQVFFDFSGTLRRDVQVYALNIGSTCKF